MVAFALAFISVIPAGNLLLAPGNRQYLILPFYLSFPKGICFSPATPADTITPSAPPKFPGAATFALQIRFKLWGW